MLKKKLQEVGQAIEWFLKLVLILTLKKLLRVFKSRLDPPLRRQEWWGEAYQLTSAILGRMEAVDIDRAIQGSSIGIQACYGVCGGAIRTSGGQTILTYGVGNPQISITGGNMIRLTEERKQDFFKILGIRQ